MECDTELCLCLEDGVQIASCPVEDTCKTRAALDAKAERCCGFTGP